MLPLIRVRSGVYGERFLVSQCNQVCILFKMNYPIPLYFKVKINSSFVLDSLIGVPSMQSPLFMMVLIAFKRYLL